LQDHLDVLLLKIATIGEGIIELRRRDDEFSAGVNVVRYFDDGPEEFDDAAALYPAWSADLPNHDARHICFDPRLMRPHGGGE